jgi:hypothetical protein
MSSRPSLHLLPTICLILFIACRKEGPPGNANVRSDTLVLTSTDWRWNALWTLSTASGTTTSYPSRYVDINTELVTQEIVDKGAVQVFFKPDNDEWVALPFIFQEWNNQFSYNIMYNYKPGNIQLHYFFTVNQPGGVPPTLRTHNIPTYTFKYVITAGK